jgi:hypothetical protein
MTGPREKGASAMSAPKGVFVPRQLLERLSEDEGITGGIGDDEAAVLLDALRKELTKRVAGRSPADAETAYADVASRGRRIARVVAAWCIDGDPEEAKRRWAKGGQGTLDAVATDDAVAAVKELLAREGLGRD